MLIRNKLNISYQAEIAVGTPPQHMNVTIDTGSPILVLNSPQILNASGGTYNASASSSHHRMNSPMDLQYIRGVERGEYMSDNITIGNTILPGFIFGVADSQPEVPLLHGLFGIGRVPADKLQGNIESFLPYYLAGAGIIPSPSYALSLNDADDPKGTILFGGVDRTKYFGSLASFPFATSGPRQKTTTVAISLRDVCINEEHGPTTCRRNSAPNSFPLDVELDSGCPGIYLPSSVTADIYDRFNITADGLFGGATCDCDLVGSNATIDFNFDNKAIIIMPVDNLIIQDSETEGEQVPLPEGRCQFLLWPDSMHENKTGLSGLSLLGFPFFHSAYVVYDFSRDEIGLAQVDYGSTTSSDIVEILPGGSRIQEITTMS